MARNTFVEANRRLEDERRAKHCGTASIRVSSLQFRDRRRTESAAQSKTAESLKRIFREERGCRQEDTRHHAKAIISPRDLEAALAGTDLTAERLTADTLPYPRLELPPGVKLECVQGGDRLSAADEVLEGANKRWVVDLFLDDLSDDLKRMLVEDYDYQKTPSDGELYCKIREYQGIGGEENLFFERLWLGRLAVSENRRKNFEQLSRHRKYAAAFDDLLEVPALLGGMRLSVVHQMIPMKCDEPNIFYLKHIRKWWTELCSSDHDSMRQIDKATVEALQGKAPGACRSDHDDLLAKLKSGQIFCNFSEEQRENMWPRICASSCTQLIPSLFTFFEDRKFLACATECMKKIVDPGPRDTIASRLEDMFTDAEQRSDRCVVQISDGSFGTIAGDESLRFDLGVRQLWLAAFRLYQDLPTDAHKKDRLAKARTRQDESALYDFASLASRLGFESEKINNILQASPDRAIAEQALLAARKPTRFQYANREQHIQQIVNIFAEAVPISTEAPEDAETGVRVQAPNRYGIPHDLEHEEDKARLFFPKLDEAVGSDQTDVSSLFVRRSVYLAYFGQPPAIEGCVADHQTGIREEPMTDQTSQPLEVSNRVELNRALIQRALDPELDEPQDNSHLNDEQSNELQRLREQIENEQTKLDQLKSLFAAEEAKIEERQTLLLPLARQEQELRASIEEKEALLRQLAAQQEEQRAKLRQLEDMRQEQERILDRLTERAREEEERQRTEMALVLRNDPLPETEERRDQDSLQTETPPASLGIRVGQRRPNRITRFSFGRLLEDAPATTDVDVANAEHRAILPTTIRIDFKLLDQNGNLKVVDTLDVDPGDPSPVRRLAGKYVRKNFCLYDTHGNNLAPKNCFEKVTTSGTNTIVLRDVSQAGTAVRKVRLVDVEEQTRRRIGRKG